MKFSFLSLGITLLLFAAAGTLAEKTETTTNAKSLAEAERAFAHEALEKGTRTAFINALSEDGTIFEPGPQHGKSTLRTAKDTGGVLVWETVLAVVASSGEFGYTTGPWSSKKSLADKEPSAFGHFASIWRRENGKWKLLFDLGSKNPKPNEPTPSLQLIDLKTPNESNSALAREAMFQRDREYVAASQKDAAAALRAAGADDVRVYRPEKFPAVSKTAAETMLKTVAQPVRYNTAQGEISQAGDLGFAWGEYWMEYEADDPKEPSGYYLRIWRKNDAGEWKLALDLMHTR